MEDFVEGVEQRTFDSTSGCRVASREAKEIVNTDVPLLHRPLSAGNV